MAPAGFEPAPSPNVNLVECSNLSELRSHVALYTVLIYIHIPHIYITYMVVIIYTHAHARTRVSFVQDT